MPKNYEDREKKVNKRSKGMKVTGRGLITVILPLLGKKSKKK